MSAYPDTVADFQILADQLNMHPNRQDVLDACRTRINDGQEGLRYLYNAYKSGSVIGIGELNYCSSDDTTFLKNLLV